MTSDFISREAREYGETPEAVQRELLHLEATYTPLPPLRALPDFLSVDDALSLFPTAELRASLRDNIHAQLGGGEVLQAALRGAYLDAEERLFALWVAGDFEQVLAIYAGARLAGHATIFRGRAWLREVLDERDGRRFEVAVESITSTSVCCLPSSLELYRVSAEGRLSRVLSFPKGESEIGPGERWTFLNHFEFKGERLLIQRVYPESDRSYELVYDRGLNRYEPTAATRQALARERADALAPPRAAPARRGKSSLDPSW